MENVKTRPKKKLAPYPVRLRRYEAEKKELANLVLSASEYRRQVIALAKKWNI
jgi:hypothetical protein